MVDKFKPAGAAYMVQRRVAGESDYRLDGLTDLLCRARGTSVFDIGCNRGMVAVDFALNGAKRVDGCDNYELGIQTAREVFADRRLCPNRFEVVDLAKGPQALSAFAGQHYDITLCLATYHKLKRIMEPKHLTDLMQHFGHFTKGYFGWRATSDKPDENDEEIENLDRDMKEVGLVRIHTSYISTELGVAAIWARA